MTQRAESQASQGLMAFPLRPGEGRFVLRAIWTLALLLTIICLLFPVNEFGSGIYDHNRNGESLGMVMIPVAALLNLFCLSLWYLWRKRAGKILPFLAMMLLAVDIGRWFELQSYYREQAALEREFALPDPAGPSPVEAQRE